MLPIPSRFRCDLPTHSAKKKTEATDTQESWRILNKLFGICDLADS